MSCKHTCKEVCDVKSRIDPYPLLAPSWNRLWPDFVTFTASKKSRLGSKSNKKAQRISNRCKDLFTHTKYFEVRCTLKELMTNDFVQNLRLNNSLIAKLRFQTKNCIKQIIYFEGYSWVRNHPVTFLQTCMQSTS